MDSVLGTSMITTRCKLRSYWHLFTIRVICVITLLALIAYFLKLCTLKIIARFITRQNTSLQYTTLSNHVPENSFTNRDKNAPDAKMTKDMLKFPIFQTSTHRAYLTAAYNEATRDQVSCNMLLLQFSSSKLTTLQDAEYCPIK